MGLIFAGQHFVALKWTGSGRGDEIGGGCPLSDVLSCPLGPQTGRCSQRPSQPPFAVTSRLSSSVTLFFPLVALLPLVTSRFGQSKDNLMNGRSSRRFLLVFLLMKEGFKEWSPARFLVQQMYEYSSLRLRCFQEWQTETLHSYLNGPTYRRSYLLQLLLSSFCFRKRVYSCLQFISSVVAFQLSPVM